MFVCISFSSCLTGLSLFFYVPADYLACRCQASLDCMDRLHSAREGFLSDNTGERIQGSFVRDAIYVVMCNNVM